MTKHFLCAMAALALLGAASSQATACELNGIKLHGKVQIVSSFADLKVEVVSSFPDLKVEKVTSFANDCGEWQFVDSFPDFKIEIVDSFPDLKIEYVTSYPDWVD